MTNETSDKAPDESPLDVKDWTVLDLLRGIRRLKLVALATVLGLLGAPYAAMWAYLHQHYKVQIERLELREAARAEFGDRFATSLANKDTLARLLPSLRSGDPDGVLDDEQVMASFLWQVKSQEGFAQFLSGDRSHSVNVMFEAGSTSFKWQDSPNLLVQILKDEMQPHDPATVSRLDRQMNLLGVAWLDNGTYVVRGLSGGLSVVRPAK